MGHPRPRARRHRGAGVPRLLPRGVGHRRVLPQGRHLLPGPGFGGQLGGLLLARHHQGRSHPPRPALRALPLHRARRSSRHRHRHRERAPGGGHPVRLRPLRPRAHRAGGQRHHLPGPLVGARHGQGPRVRAGPAGRVVEAGRRLGAGGGDRRPARPRRHPRPRHPRQRPGAGPPGGGLPPAPRHPLGGHGHLRPPGHRGVPGGVGAHGRPQRPAVGQGRLRGRRPREVRPPRPGHAHRAPRRHRPRRRATAVARSTWPPSPRRTRSTTCSARPTRWGCSRWRAGPRWPRCPGSSPARSTTSWWRSPSSGPGPSREGRCTPTSGGATARSR